MMAKFHIILIVWLSYIACTSMLILAEIVIAKMRRKKVNKPELASDVAKMGVMILIATCFVMFL